MTSCKKHDSTNQNQIIDKKILTLAVIADFLVVYSLPILSLFCCVVVNNMLRLEMIINQELEIKRYTNCFPRFCSPLNYSYKEQFIGRIINLRLN